MSNARKFLACIGAGLLMMTAALPAYAEDAPAEDEGIKVGDTYDDLLAKYGTPDQETPAYAMYQTEGKAVRFFLEGENIKQIVYTIVM